MQEINDISHREIYDRLIDVEKKVDELSKNTKDVVSAFESAKGAFVVLEIVGRMVKPLLWLGGIIVAVTVFFQNIKAGR